MISYEEFYERWNNASRSSIQKKHCWKKYVPNQKKIYQIFPKFKSRIKYKNLYKMYCETNDMKMSSFRRCVEYFVEVHDFKNWRGRMRWIGNNYSSKSVTYNKMISYYGEKEGSKRWRSYCQKQAQSNTFAYKQMKYGMTKDEFDAYNKSRSVTLKNCIRRHGIEKGTKIFDDYREKQRDAGCSLKYFQEKYGELEGEKFYHELNKKKTMSMDNFIRKYGEVIGVQKFYEYFHKRRYDFYSDIANEFFNEITNKIVSFIDISSIYYSLNNYECSIVDEFNEKTYFLDYTIPELQYCIEFNGDYWHCNPVQYSSTDIVKFPFGKCLVQDIWDRDKKKLDCLKSQGYTCKIIWERDYKADKEKTINLCVSEIKLRHQILEGKRVC